MSPAEFKTRREGLGISARWLAYRWGVSLQSVQKWGNDGRIPEEYESDFRRLEQCADDAVAKGIQRHEGTIEVPRTEGRSGKTGYPSAYYRALALRIARVTGADIIYMSEED